MSYNRKQSGEKNQPPKQKKNTGGPTDASYSRGQAGLQNAPKASGKGKVKNLGSEYAET